MDDDIETLFANNKTWADQMRARDPEFFSRLVNQQSPRHLWIGCSDSRVPANEIVGLQPGEVFVHRNVANLVIHTDLNCLSVIQYAVDVLQVRHIMVVGHYGCGGVQAVIQRRQLGLVDNWLQHVEDVRSVHGRRLDAMADDHARVDRLCEINAIEQVSHVSRLSVVRAAWGRGQPLDLHGMIYGLQDGILHSLCPPVSATTIVVDWRKKALRALWEGTGGLPSSATGEDSLDDTQFQNFG